MKFTPLASLLGFALVASCSHPPHTATVSRSQQLASESATALNAKDYTRAQTLATEALHLDGGFAEAWVGYGMASLRLGQTNEARLSYERALWLHQERHRQTPSDANQVYQQIFLLSLLGRSVEAESLLTRAHTDFPSDYQISTLAGHFSEVKQGWESWTVRPQ